MLKLLMALLGVLLLAVPVSATTMEITSGSVGIIIDVLWDQNARMVSSDGIEIQSFTSADANLVKQGLGVGHLSLLWQGDIFFNGTWYSFSPGAGTFPRLELDFVTDPFTVLATPPSQDPSQFGKSENHPFAMTGVLELPGLAAIDLFGQGVVTATWQPFSTSFGPDFFTVGFAFQAPDAVPVPEPVTILLLALSLVGIASWHRMAARI